MNLTEQQEDFMIEMGMEMLRCQRCEICLEHTKKLNETNTPFHKVPEKSLSSGHNNKEVKNGN
jgi:hypothetical protein